jgi:hypothetical protein
MSLLPEATTTSQASRSLRSKHQKSRENLSTTSEEVIIQAAILEVVSHAAVRNSMAI